MLRAASTPGLDSRPPLFLSLAVTLSLVGLGSCAPGESSSDGAGEQGTRVTGIVAEPGELPFERVVFVSIDTLRADHLGSYGYFRSTAPFLDRLADESLVFDSAMSASSHTAPSHASMFTGLAPGLHGLLTNGSRLGAEVATMAGSLGEAGFDSAAFTSVEFLEGVAEGFGHVRSRTTKAEGISNAAITWMRKERASDRFFLWMHYYDPHRWKMLERIPDEHLRSLRARTNLSSEEAYAEVAKLHGLPLPFSAMDWREGDKGVEEVSTKTLEDVMAYIDSYDAQITYADAEIARVYRALEGLELEGETLWIITSDHGEGLGSHDYAGHGWQVYQEQLRVPLILHGTGSSIQPRRIAGLVSLTDLFPTVVDLLGGDIAGDLSPWTGRSLVPLFSGGELEGDALAFSQRRPLRKTGGDGVFALQDEGYKLILRMTGDDEFFDLTQDPFERDNLHGSGGPAFDRLQAELQRRLAVLARLGLTAGEGNEEWAEELQKLGYAQ